MAGKISMAARAEVTAAIRERYRASGRAAKGAILDEFVAVTGVHRKHAIRLLSLKGAVRRPRGRPEPAAAEDLVELREVEVGQEEREAELVRDCAEAAMPDEALVQAALHQPLASIRSQTASALCTPSSWKPQPQYAPAKCTPPAPSISAWRRCAAIAAASKTGCS